MSGLLVFLCFSVLSVLQAYRIVVFATLFLSVASVLGPPSSWQPPSNAVRVDARNEFDSGLNLCPSAFICGSIGFGCGLRGRAVVQCSRAVAAVLGTRLRDSPCESNHKPVRKPPSESRWQPPSEPVGNRLSESAGKSGCIRPSELTAESRSVSRRRPARKQGSKSPSSCPSESPWRPPWEPSRERFPPWFPEGRFRRP